MRIPQLPLTLPRKNTAGDDLNAHLEAATACYQSIIPDTPERFVDQVNEHGQVVLSKQDLFNQQFARLNSRREIMQRVGTLRQLQANIMICEGSIEEIEYNVQNSGVLIPGVRLKCQGQVAELHARIESFKETIAHTLLELSVLVAAVRSSD